MLANEMAVSVGVMVWISSLDYHSEAEVQELALSQLPIGFWQHYQLTFL